MLAFGLGASTAIFSVLYSAVLKPLPYPEPDRLVAVHNRYPQLHLTRIGASPRDYFDLAEHHELFADAGVFYFLDLSRTGVDRPEKVNAVAVSASLFRTLGMAPVMGETFSSQEESFHGPHAVILSDAYWRAEFAADPGVLNRTLQLNGELYRIAGIMPGTFQFPNKVTQMWVPITFDPAQTRRGSNQAHFLRMYGRLAPGVGFEQASARMDELSRQMPLEHPEDYPPALEKQGWRFFLLPMDKDNDGSLRRWLYILFAAVICLLVIVGSNVAGLLLVRATERRFELSIRRALGASRFRVARQVLTEILLLAVAGGIGACWIAEGGVKMLAEYAHAGEPQLELPALLFLVVTTLLTGLACGLYPAWLATRVTVSRGLKEGGHQRTASGAQQRLRHSLIVGQVAIATTLLIGGGLLIRSLFRILDTSPGFEARNVLTLQVSLPRARYPNNESRGRFYQALLERIARSPGVEDASACTQLPFGYGESVNTFEILGRPKPRVDPYAILNNVLPGFFQTMRIPLLTGRGLNGQDRAGAQPVTVIDDVMAKRFFPGKDPVGQQIKMAWDKPFTIVGVVGSVKTSGLDLETRPVLYFSALQYPSTDMSLVIRSPLTTDSMTATVRQLVTEADKDQPVYNIAPMQTWIDRSLETRRLVVSLILVFAAAGTLLAALGLYGVLAYTIALRRREIGIRMVLGANSGLIASSIARRGMVLVFSGLIIGSAGALAVNRYIASQLYGASSRDGLTWVAVICVVTVTGLLASAIPAWRAAHFDPMEALREE